MVTFSCYFSSPGRWRPADTLWATLFNKLAVTSQISLWCKDGNPLVGQERLCNTETSDRVAWETIRLSTIPRTKAISNFAVWEHGTMVAQRTTRQPAGSPLLKYQLQNGQCHRIELDLQLFWIVLGMMMDCWSHACLGSFGCSKNSIKWRLLLKDAKYEGFSDFYGRLELWGK